MSVRQPANDAKDIVFISNLQIETVIGVYDWEQNTRQTVRLDIELACNAAMAAENDEIELAVDYQAVCDRMNEYISASKVKLVETLAQRCAEVLLSEFGVAWVRLRVTKPGAVPVADGVGVLIERTRELPTD